MDASDCGEEESVARHGVVDAGRAQGDAVDGAKDRDADDERDDPHPVGPKDHLGGARRDEERSRAKERVFSLRNSHHRWDPKRQRPEPWRLYNGRKRKGESIRVFPLSNWTELDVWHYIHKEHIPVVPLYFAAPRPVVTRDGILIMRDDDRLPLAPDEQPQIRNVRFRTLGCYPLTGAVESTACTVPDIIRELAESNFSERCGRIIDRDGAASMERKKQEGYF